jgi:hypothetical protein
VGITEKRIGAEIVIYPNPAGEFFTVGSQQSAVFSRFTNKGSSLSSEISISIYNVYSQRIDRIIIPASNPWQQRFNISTYPGGIYFVIIESNEAPISIMKLIKN